MEKNVKKSAYMYMYNWFTLQKKLTQHCRDFPGGPVVKNPPSNAGDAGLIPGRGTRITHAAGQLSPRATTTELACLNERACVPQTTEPMSPGACTPQLERSLHTTMKSPHRNERSHALQLRPDAVKKIKKIFLKKNNVADKINLFKKTNNIVNQLYSNKN